MIQVALLGFGTVGSGTAEVLTHNQSLIENTVGDSIHIKYILDLREFPDSPFSDVIVHDFNTILNDTDVSVVAEMMGGAHPAYDFTKALLESGKSVVTSNKEVVATFGTELLRIAAEHHCAYLFEASVGGGIPIISPMRNDLAQNRIKAVSGILNGTTNYMLTKMICEGVDFNTVLKDAQDKGYAERNPAADIEGLDAARKIVILAAMAFGKRIDPNMIYCEGITNITAEDCAVAESMGGTVKLIGYTALLDGKVLAMVSPRFVPVSNPISSVNDVFNGILVEADMVGKVMFYGPGAGKLPTASAVVSDMIASMPSRRKINLPIWTDALSDEIASMETYTCRNLLVLEDTDDANVIDILPFDICYVKKVNGRIAVITAPVSEKNMNFFIQNSGCKVISRFRVLD